MGQFSGSSWRQVEDSRRQFAQGDGLPFAEVLSQQCIQQTWRAEGCSFRDRLYSPWITIMAQAAAAHNIAPRTISFKGTLQTLLAFQPQLAQCRSDDYHRLHAVLLATHRHAPCRRSPESHRTTSTKTPAQRLPAPHAATPRRPKTFADKP